MKKIITALSILSLLLSAPLNFTAAQATGPAIKNDTLANAYAPDTPLVAPPSVVAEICTPDDVVALKKSASPATAIFSVDKNLNVIGSDGRSFGITLAQAWSGYCSGKVIPAVRIPTREIADSFLAYCANELDLLDMAVVSDSAELLRSVREANGKIRGILDWTGKEVSEADWQNVVSTTNAALANVALLNAADATYDAVRYMQARLKTVWAAVDNATQYSAMQAVATGAYGIVTDSPETVFDCYASLKKSGYKRILSRSPYNIAHRGLCLTNYENSMEGFIAAYESGATHLELDVQLTKDKKIVVMHDSTIDRTTNGKGTISDMNAAELDRYKIITKYPDGVLGEGVPIPDLDDVFTYFKGRDIVLTVEIKAGSADFVTAFKEYLNRHDMFSQVVCISFNEAQLSLMRLNLPRIPTANLNTLTVANFAEKLGVMGNLNTAWDNSYGNAQNNNLSRMLADRGYMSWYWTYSYYSDIVSGVYAGTAAITNNSADAMAKLAARAGFSGSYAVTDNSSAMINFETYGGGSVPTARGVVVAQTGEGAARYGIFLAEYASEDGTCGYALLTQPVRFVPAEKYISPAEMKRILALHANALSAQDLTTLRRMEAAYVLLDAHEQADIDFERIAQLIREADALAEEPVDNEPGSDSGCGCNGAQSAAVLLPVLVFALAALKR